MVASLTSSILDTSSGIEGVYTVRLLDEPPTGPDVVLKSAKGKIDADVTLLGSRLGRIEVDTRNHPLRLRFNAHGSIQMQATSGSGELQVRAC